MKTDDYGISVIKSFEGLKLCAYQDSAGYWTAGYGSLYTNIKTGERVQPGTVFTMAQAEQMLRDEIEEKDEALNKLITTNISQNMYNACSSFAFNVGQNNFAKSSILRFINAGNFQAAADAFLLWNRAGGLEIQGLTNRRQIERSIFMHGMNDLNQAPVETPEEAPAETPVPVSVAEQEAAVEAPLSEPLNPGPEKSDN